MEVIIKRRFVLPLQHPMEVIIKRRFVLPRQHPLIIMTPIIMTLIFIIEVLITVLWFHLPPMSPMVELLLSALFLSIATILTLYLFLFRSWVRGITKRGPKLIEDATQEVKELSK